MFFDHKRIKLGIRSGKVSEKVLKYLKMTQCNSKYSSHGSKEKSQSKTKKYFELTKGKNTTY